MILDYKYIEQLLEGYFNGETTIEEEKILRAFFCQDELPENLLQYRDIFAYQQNETKEDRLGADFDAKIMALIEEETSNAQPAKPFLQVVFKRTTKALHPFFKAAAIVAVVITIGNASQVLFSNTSEEQQGIARVETTNGKNVAGVQKGDSIIKDTLAILND